MTSFTDLRQTQEFGQFLKKIKWQVENLGDMQIFVKKIPIIGYFIKIQRPNKIEFEKLKEYLNKKRPSIITIEPKNETQISDLQNYGFRRRGNPYLCSKTLQIDLSGSANKILAEMKKDNRYQINKTLKEKVIQLNKVGIEEFQKAWKESVGIKRWVPSINYLNNLSKAFSENIIFLTAHKNNQILAGDCLIFAENVAYYYYAFSNLEGKKLGAPYFLVWQGILEAKKRGCKVFDFEGIYDERFKVTNSWKGFTHFKKGFGGKEVIYPQPYQKFLFFNFH